MSKKIGILVVHGIGNQGRFEHLEEVARNFILCLRPNHDVSVEVKISNLGEFKSKKEVWSQGKNGTVIIDVSCKDTDERYELHFREVWWSYLGEPTNIKTVLKFWFWGVSFWNDHFYCKKDKCDSETDWIYPTSVDKDSPSVVTFRERWELYVACILTTGMMPALALVKRLLELLGVDVPLDIISQYLSKVKLYQQENRDSKEPIENIGEVPRTSIRRRLVSELVNMASGDYHYWYILAHSLGSVVAYNGLFEEEQILARYLDRKQWIKACNQKLNKKIDVSSSDNKSAQLEPCKPYWLEEEDAISRSELFSKLRGFLTYGPHSAGTIVQAGIFKRWKKMKRLISEYRILTTAASSPEFVMKWGW